MKIQSSVKTLRPKTPFQISRGTKHFVDNVFIRLNHQGILGYGEAAPNAYYGESAIRILELLDGLDDFFRNLEISHQKDIEDAWQESWKFLAPSRAAQCAVDVALWDMLAKQKQTTLSRLIWGSLPRPLATSYTMGICPPEHWNTRMSQMENNNIVKVKMKADLDLRLLRFLQAYPQPLRIYVDANCAWNRIPTRQILQALSAFDIEVLEQPFTPDHIHLQEELLPNVPFPIIADESCRTLSDLEHIAPYFTGINIKLAKCGGITPALKMAEKARQTGLQIMVGCMLESSLLISAGLCVAQNADFVDLDGSWLLEDPLFEGISVKNGIIQPSHRDGLGVAPNVQDFL